MKLLGRSKGRDEGDDVSATPDHDSEQIEAASRAARTGPKGRPTPKRNEARRQGRKGPVAPAPMTASEARARRKTLAGPKLSKEERRAERDVSRAKMSDRRERMMSGEEGYLLPRDQGPVRRYVRDIVDARRNVLGLFMPSALALLAFMFALPQLQFYVSPAMLGLMVLMTGDGFVLAHKVGKLVDAKFPDNTESRWKLGIYAAGRASQMRRMRAPRPQVKRGSDVS